MQISKTLLGSLTLFAFISALAMNGLAQTATNDGTGGSSIPIYTPAQFSATTATNALDKKIAACIAGDAATAVIKKTSASAAAAKGDCYNEYKRAGSGDPKWACGMTCAAPQYVSEPKCDKYYKKDLVDVSSSDTGTSKKHINWTDELSGTGKFKSGASKLSEDQDTFNAYISFTTYSKDNCTTAKQEDLKKKAATYACLKTALNDAISLAGTSLQGVLTKNAGQYDQINQYQSQVGDQMRQIDETLGADPNDPSAKEGGAQFGGLLGMQKEMATQLATMKTNGANFKTEVTKVQTDSDTNEQTLEANRMGQIVDCMKGNRNLGVSGGRSLMCYKPQMGASTKDASGKTVDGAVAHDSSGNIIYSKQPCGAIEYVRSQVEQSAFATSRGVIKSQKRAEKSQEYAAAFDAMFDGMLRDMGSYDAASADGKLVGRNTDWATLSKKYAANMMELTNETGIYIQTQMNQIAATCYSDGDSWKKQQQRSSSSEYTKKKNAIADEKTQLTTKLNQGLTDLNSLYGKTMAVMFGATATINRFQCTTTDAAKMQSCYDSIQQNLNDLKEGNGAATGTLKPITGGSLVSAFTIPCKGIDGCVTAFQAVRKQKKDQLGALQKAKLDYVTKGNAQIQQQMQVFGQQVMGVQAKVLASFDAMKALMTDMKVSGSKKLNFLTAEPLEPSEGPNKEPGPFKNPKSMASALSMFVQPSGVINTQDDGVDEMMNNANEMLTKQKDDLKDKIEKYADVATKLGEMYNKCVVENNQDKVGSKVAGSSKTENVHNLDCTTTCGSDLKQACQDNTSPIKDETWVALQTAAENMPDIAQVDAKNQSTIDKEQNKLALLKKEIADIRSQARGEKACLAKLDDCNQCGIDNKADFTDRITRIKGGTPLGN